MKVEYAYHFSNGDKITVSVEESDCEQLTDLDRNEYNNNKKARRRGVSLEALNVDDNLFPANVDIAREVEEAELVAELLEAIGCLTEPQQELISKIFLEEVKPSEIAREQGVSKAAITRRMNRALQQLRKLLE